MMIMPPIVLYAETHYRFRYFLSFLKTSEPEIIADAPHRLDPEAPLPVLVMVKDAHRYPVQIIAVNVTVKRGTETLHRRQFDHHPPAPIDDRFWWAVYSIPFEGSLENVFGHLEVDVEIVYGHNGKRKTARNNNHRTSSKRSMSVYRSRTPLPALPGWIHGDAHTHSQYTDDQVEFGSPIGAGPDLCRAMGLSFFCVTDHSYDLDDTLHSYLENDPSLPKWHRLQNEISEVNEREKDFVVVRGEEVSCTSTDGRTVHLLLLGSRTFIHGSGDSAERWFHTECEHTVPAVLEARDATAAAFAAHPTEEVPFIQTLLINRGEWTKKDMTEDRLHGIQVLNGERSEAFYNGLDAWKWLLLRGDRKFIIAGNDAHGNYNRFIQIGIPFFTIREKEHQLFGKMKTAVYAPLSEDGIVAALQEGRCVITNGPMVSIEIETDTGDTAMIGQFVHGQRFVVKVRARSTEEFGVLRSVIVYLGVVGKREKVFLETRQFPQPYETHFITDWETATNISYIRAEAHTNDAHGTDREGFCYTNPIWIQTE